MANASEELRPPAEELTQNRPLRKLLRTARKKRTASLRHLFGPVALVAMICLLFMTITLLFWDIGQPDYKLVTVDTTDLKGLFESQLKDYKAGLARLDANLSFQGILIATTILVIIRQSDTLNFFGNSVPLSWLHFFIPIVLVYLWLSSGYIVHELILGRLRGGAIADASPILGLEFKKLFRDAGWIDGWFVSFIDTDARPSSGVDRTYASSTKTLLIIVLGTLISATHASALALVSIGCRRYLATGVKRRLLWYYLAPVVPLIFFIISHFLFAYGGQNRNIFQIYVAVVSLPLMAFLLWLSAKIDIVSYPETLRPILRMRELTLAGSIERLPIKRNSQSAPDNPEKQMPAFNSDRTIALIGDSLSTIFYVSSLPQMMVRIRRGWRRNWFLLLPHQDEGKLSVLARLSLLGTITGIHHASVSAMVDDTKRSTLVSYLTGTYHFSHQVDEVLTRRFPNILLLWIGHNDVDWRSRTDSQARESLLELSTSFAIRYEIQLRKLIDGALASEDRSVIVVFGLVNFESFFRARAQAEVRRGEDTSLFPHLESSYKYFVSMRPEYRDGMIQLATLINERLKLTCTRLAKQLSDSNVRLVYSAALSDMDLSDATFLNTVDAWHASNFGHGVLADNAYPTVYQQAQFLGWESESNSPNLPENELA